MLSTRRLAEVPQLLAEAAERVEREHLWAAGWVAYEAAPGFDPALVVREPGPDDPPLLWLALFAEASVAARGLSSLRGDVSLAPFQPSVDPRRYRRGVAEIRRRIAAGDTYQVNYTHRLRAAFDGDPRALFRDLARAQRGRHAAFFDGGRFAVCAATPELFFALDGRRLTMRPMKGTARRGLLVEDDRRRVAELAASAKDRAENLMIVDMVRNDLGRIARPGTVAVPELFAVERYPTLLQMTSTVTAESDAPVAQIFAALFPCASVTGAPKASTMAIIAELEDSPRGVYTGAVGYLAPGRQARFGVAIRTAVVDRERAEVTYGVGGGIVWDSQAEREWRECRLKAEVVTAALARSHPPWPDRFELLETLRWDPGEGFLLLPEHLERLAGSAEYFGFRCDLAAVQEALAGAAAGVAEPSRLRLRLDREGVTRIDRSPLAAGRPRLEPPEPAPEPAAPGRRSQPPVRLALAAEPVDRRDPFLYHKTTHREVYETAAAAHPDGDEVLLWNRAGEVTEGTVTNLVVRCSGRWVTPPARAGLLPGTLRAHLLARGLIHEETVRTEELAGCEELWLINSVRGWRGAELVAAH